MGGAVVADRQVAVQSEAALTVEVLRGDAGLVDALADEWRTLCAEGVCAEPFYRPEWIAAFLGAFRPGARLVVLTARRGGLLRGVLVLVEERIGPPLFGVRCLRAPVNPHANRFDLVHGADDREQVIDAVWQTLRRMRGWDQIDVRDTPEGGAVHRLALLAAAAGYATNVGETFASPMVPLPGADGDPQEVLGRTATKFRANLRRRRRNLAARGPLRLVRAEHADPTVLERFYRLEASGWKGRAGTAIAADPSTRRFYDAVVEAAARFGYLTIYTLECADRPVAMHLGLTMDGRYAVPKLAYDETYREYAPGHLLIEDVLADCVARGLREFDFLGLATPWKLEWAPSLRRHLRCVVARGPRGRALHAIRFRLLPVGYRRWRRLLAATRRGN